LSLALKKSPVVKKDTYKRQIDNWIRERIAEGKIQNIIDVVLILLMKPAGKQMPVFSSFPGDVQSEVSYKMSVFQSEANTTSEYPRKLVMRSLRHLSAIQVAIFCFRDIDECRQPEVAKILGCSQQYVSQQEKRIKAILGKDKYLKELISGSS